VPLQESDEKVCEREKGQQRFSYKSYIECTCTQWCIFDREVLELDRPEEKKGSKVVKYPLRRYKEYRTSVIKITLEQYTVESIGVRRVLGQVQHTFLSVLIPFILRR
jgi:hypothetical protein